MPRNAVALMTAVVLTGAVLFGLAREARPAAARPTAERLVTPRATTRIPVRTIRPLPVLVPAETSAGRHIVAMLHAALAGWELTAPAQSGLQATHGPALHLPTCSATSDVGCGQTSYLPLKPITAKPAAAQVGPEGIVISPAP